MASWLKISAVSVAAIWVAACSTTKPDSIDSAPVAAEKPTWAIVIHGGAGVITPENMTPERETAYRAALQNALDTGTGLLQDGKPALDVVESVIHLLEDDPLFNAGKGAVLTEDGGFSLDSSIMDGKTLDAGAVAGLSNVRHPISAARKVMTSSPHVLLAGDGADSFAKEQGLEIIHPSYFFTERRWDSLLKVLEKRGQPAPVRPESYRAPEKSPTDETAQPKLSDLMFPDDHKYGTVGVVVLDMNGNYAAGTSTGGTTAKRWGRVGDSPIIGAGTYAKNNVCGVSATGTGEYFIRLSVAYAICSRIELAGESAQDAADFVIHTDLSNLEGDGGVIFLGPDGRPGWSFNTKGMYRASAFEGGVAEIGIYGSDE